jgi:hypothetical protein
MPPKATKRRPTDAEKVCPHCGNTFNARGYGRHEPACRRQVRQETITPTIDTGSVNPELGTDGMSCTLDLGRKLVLMPRIPDDFASMDQIGVEALDAEIDEVPDAEDAGDIGSGTYKSNTRNS